jgi:hypothetical protein
MELTSLVRLLYRSLTYDARAEDPLVATGYLLDTIKLDPLEGHSVVSSRKFVVDRLISPEHFKPVVLPLVA